MKRLTIINLILSIVLLALNIMTLVHLIDAKNNMPTCVGPAQQVTKIIKVSTDVDGNVEVE